MKRRNEAYGPTPIFILGMIKKAGSNYLHRLLGLHPGCASYPVWEDYLIRFLPTLERYSLELDGFYSSKKKYELMRISRPDLNVLRDTLNLSLGLGIVRHINRVACSHQKRVILKTPTIDGVETFFKFFGDAPLIILIRDGRTTAESMRRWTGESLESCARDWADAAFRVGAMQKAAEAENGCLLVVRYEDLYSSTQSELKRIFKFLGMSTKFYPFAAAQNLPVTYSSTFNSKGKYHVPRDKTKDFLPLENCSNWTRQDHKTFNSVAGKAQKLLGY